MPATSGPRDHRGMLALHKCPKYFGALGVRSAHSVFCAIAGFRSLATSALSPSFCSLSLEWNMHAEYIQNNYVSRNYENKVATDCFRRCFGCLNSLHEAHFAVQARGLHLKQAEQPIIIDGSADRLKTSAVMRQARMLLCLSIQGFQVLESHRSGIGALTSVKTNRLYSCLLCMYNFCLDHHVSYPNCLIF